MTETGAVGTLEPDDRAKEIQDRKDRLITIVGLLREAMRHLQGAQSLRPDKQVASAIDHLGEAERDAGVEILSLAGNVAADPPASGQDLVSCDVSGVLAGGETLESGPLSISIRGPAIEVRLRRRQTVILGVYPSGLVGFHAMTDGRDCPEIVRPAASGETALVSMGQGSSQVDVMPRDVH